MIRKPFMILENQILHLTVVKTNYKIKIQKSSHWFHVQFYILFSTLCVYLYTYHNHCYVFLYSSFFELDFCLSSGLVWYLSRYESIFSSYPSFKYFWNQFRREILFTLHWRTIFCNRTGLLVVHMEVFGDFHDNAI